MVELSPRKRQEILDSPAVQRALRAKAARVLPRAQRIAADAGALGLARGLRVVEGRRPGAKAREGLQRPYARIEAEITDELLERDAGAKITRTQILRRASRA